VSRLWDPQVDQWVWQRRAVGQLAAILKDSPDLPVITWTVCAGGGGLTGQVGSLGAPEWVRSVFEGWRAGLGLGEGVETVLGGGVCHLRAVSRRDRVPVTLTAVVSDHDPMQPW
jgi:hypothetical protein